MNTSAHPTDSNLSIAETYYKAMIKEKNFSKVEQYLHPDVNFIGPLAKMSGKEAVLQAAKQLSKLCDDFTIRATFSAGNQIMLAYDLMLHEPIGRFSAAVLMDFKSGQISKIELFYDARPFEAIQNEIFAQGR